VIFIVEGKKYRALGKDCQAVSEVIGEVLMIAMVVLAFSGIALTVFSDEGAANPPHTPDTALREKINTDTDTVWIFHSGGEAIDLDEINIILSVNGTPTEFNVSPGDVWHSDERPTDGIFRLGDRIEIKTNKKGVNLTSNDSIDMFFVHTPSEQVIQRAVLQ
jgi:FlaG/FlaF family flagellin (archaellin)